MPRLTNYPTGRKNLLMMSPSLSRKLVVFALSLVFLGFSENPRIFGRLTAWQNWSFQRPNAVGKEGALQRYGTGVRGKYDMERV